MKDILLADEKDIAIANGDFAIGESDQQDIELILISFKGEWKINPLLGAELPRMVKMRNPKQKMLREINEQLKIDGFHNIDFKLIDAENFNINAKRNAT